MMTRRHLTDEELDALLAGAGPLDDDGFTSRVMQSLPPRRASRRTAILATATCAGGLVTALATGKIAVVLAGGIALGPAAWASAALLLGVVGALAGTAAAVAKAEA